MKPLSQEWRNLRSGLLAFPDVFGPQNQGCIWQSLREHLLNLATSFELEWAPSIMQVGDFSCCPGHSLQHQGQSIH